MKIYNWTLLVLALFLAVPNIPAAFRHKEASDFIILIWLVSIPAATLITMCVADKHKKVTSLIIGAIYNGVSAIAFIVYAISVNVLSSHPVAFAITGMLLTFMLAIVVGINSAILYSKSLKYKASNKTNVLGQ